MSNIWKTVETEGALVPMINAGMREMAHAGTPAVLLICDPAAEAFIMRNGDFDQWPSLNRLVVPMSKGRVILVAEERATRGWPAPATLWIAHRLEV